MSAYSNPIRLTHPSKSSSPIGVGLRPLLQASKRRGWDTQCALPFSVSGDHLAHLELPRVFSSSSRAVLLPPTNRLASCSIPSSQTVLVRLPGSASGGVCLHPARSRSYPSSNSWSTHITSVSILSAPVSLYKYIYIVASYDHLDLPTLQQIHELRGERVHFLVPLGEPQTIHPSDFRFLSRLVLISHVFFYKKVTRHGSRKREFRLPKSPS